MARYSEFFTYPTKADLKFLLFYTLSFYLLTFAYNFTLQGGDIKYLTDHVAIFAGTMISVCIICVLLTTLALSRFRSVKIITKLVSLLFGWWIILSNALEDMNTTLQYHGQYNFLMFSLLCSLGFTLYLIIMLCVFTRKKLSPTKFYGSILISFILFLIVWTELSRREKLKWKEGLGKIELQYEYPGCNIDLPGTPWIGIIPQKTFNFYLSSECPEVKKFSKFKDGVLKIDCDKEYAKIVENPNFLEKHVDEFIIEENGWENWKEVMKSQEKTYKVPGKSTLNITSSYFQVFCGKSENYYVQHIPNTTKFPNLPPETHKMNLLIFQIDTLSRAHFMRRMQKTVQKLEALNKSENFEVFQMMRLSTIGYNTEVNTKALYTGSQYRSNRSGRPLWDIFQKQGNAVMYLNGFCEDWSSRFLKKMPSGMDYFVFQPWCHPDYTPVNKTFSNFDGVNSIHRRCINGRRVHERVFGYLKEFWKSHLQVGKMVMAPLQESHEASMDVISTLDPGMSSLLDWFEDTNELNNTIILITSDHGSHMSFYYIFSETGKLEHKLPGMFFIFPSWFLQKYPSIRENLKKNEQPLVSHYDTHWSLVSLSSLSEFGGHPESKSFNSYTAVWDCRKNEKYIKDIWFFRDKTFYNVDALDNFDVLLTKVKTRMQLCMNKYKNQEPDQSPIRQSVKKRKNIKYENLPPCQSPKCYEELNVFEVIQDKESYFWLLDALDDMQSDCEVTREDDLVLEYYSDFKVFDDFKSTGLGRYKQGASLFHYSTNKTCSALGTEKWCACS